MNMKKREISIEYANSNDDEIMFYLNSYVGFYVKGTYVNNNSIYISIESEKQDLTSKEFRKSFNILLQRIFLTSLKTLLILMLLILNFSLFSLFSISIYFFLSFTLSTIISSLFILFNYVFIKSSHHSDKLKNNHTAEHMISNFIDNYQRLPISMEELRKSSRFHKDCGSLTDFKDFLHSLHFSIYLYVSLLFYAVSVFFDGSISLQEKVFSSIMLVAIIILLKILLEKKSYWLNFFLQLSNTTSHVDDDSLYLAYFVAREWIARDYPEYASEEWMQNSEFLDDVSETHSVDSQEASNI